MRRVKIVCTIGPATSSEEKLEQLVEAGMDVARLNCSHGSNEERIKIVQRIRRVSERQNRSVCILLDLRGPRLRVGNMAEPRTVTQGDEIKLVTQNSEPAPEGAIPVGSPFLAAGVAPGQKIFIDDGNNELTVLATDGVTIRCRVERDGMIRSRKGINAPGAHLAVPILENEDLEDLRTIIKEGIDAISISFVRSVADVEQVRSAVHAFSPGLPLIAKLETSQAVKHLDSILEVSNGIMVARGDLGVELPTEEVPILQKRLIREANTHGKPVITATQMLESMTDNQRPTRAEASDVANAVFDGTDCVMLSAETSVGKYPVETVQMMNRIIAKAEEQSLARPREWRKHEEEFAHELAVAEAGCHAAEQLKAKAIIVFTRTGRAAIEVSQCRSSQPLFAFTPEQATYQRLNLIWGVRPVRMDFVDNPDDLIDKMEKQALEMGILEPGDTVVVLAGIPVKVSAPMNFIKVHKIGGPS